ncbi:phage/plasmid primase, P4 family [Streptomyces sp. RK76]|uniref:phage/plasmid primase, P4 family n=1 Tax=Streptomyces sp. RK76 TaxID=2824896 RepID=UPI001B39B558|nr:phage/plasmid primase, P4 family [Streptomyces sp. RK76]MBQ0947680.1 bifunctional DNA primase/polymerase [Streptomyces sp. RK76]
MSSTPQPDTLTTALAWHTAGASVVRVATDGTKRPAGNWKDAQTVRATPEQLHAWFADGHPGVGLVLGEVSSHLEMLEFEGRAVTEGVAREFGEICEASGLGPLWDMIKRGYCERTPSGGYHLIYSVLGGPVLPNTKLASRPSTAEELAAAPKAKQQVLIETRGEGGFVVVAPSHGPVHATGQPWELLAGGPSTIAEISVGERDALFAIARMLDQTPAAPEPTPAAPADEASAFLTGTRPTPDGGLSPLDDFEQRTSWADILKPHGWQLLFTSGHTSYWRRPGKDTPGVSATTGRDPQRDRLYVFTSSSDFTPEVPYTKPGAYALLEHGGNHSNAARELRRRGYGQAPERTRHLTSVPAATPTTPTVDGTAALAVNEPTPEPGQEMYTRTDDGNALRLVDRHAHEIRYCPQRGWLNWDGHRWTWDERGHIAELARDIARSLPEGEGDLQHKARSLSARGLESMVKVARTDPRVVAPLATLDAKPWQLNTPAGVVDLRTGQISAPAPEQLHTRSTSVAPDFEADAPRFRAFLNDTFASDPDLITYVQRLLGLSLIGEVREQILPFAFGEGANGKSTLADTVMRLAGIGETGYAISAPSEMLLASSANSHPTEIARLAGARLVVASELDDGQRFAEARIKMLTGRDIITGRFMRQDFFSFAPTHTLWLLGNHRPAVRTGGPAFWRRLRLVPFLHTVPEHLRDTGLEEHLVDHEGPAILAWLIRGAADYASHGLPTPAAVQQATDEYQGEQDTIARFVADMCVLGLPGTAGMQTPSGALRGAYETWCQQEGEEQPVSAKKFAAVLQKPPYNVRADRNSRFRFFDGIALRTEGAAR